MTFRKINELRNWSDNPRDIKPDRFQELKNRITRFGQFKPVIVTPDGEVLGGNMRLKAMKELGIEDIWVSVVEPKSEAEKIEIALTDNEEMGFYEDKQLADLIEKYKGEIELGDYSVHLGEPINLEDLIAKFAPEPEEDEIPEVSQDEPISKLGEIYQLGRHRVMCGDSTKIEDVEKLMDGKKADMVFTDPPYGMKKENEGVLNDNLNYDDLLEFNKQWIPLSFTHLKDNGSWYCWGTDEPLMDIYAFILKAYIKDNKVTFRNLITWDKGNGQGQNSKEYRMYAIADEKLLFCMTGVQGFNNNQDNYYEAWEPVRLYLDGEKKRMGWSDKWIAEQLNIDPRLHWFSKSQWELPTEDKYNALRELAQNDAFKRDYDEIKRDYYATRAYFDNTHDNMNNVWRFNRDTKNTDHATPKPIEVCARAIKSSSRENELCLDLFLGSGSTLIACEQTNRICYGMELDPKYVDVIRKRYSKLINPETWETEWEQLTPKTEK